jgi:hypothetical protein
LDFPRKNPGSSLPDQGTRDPRFREFYYLYPWTRFLNDNTAGRW